MDKKYKVTPINIWYAFLLIAVPMICTGGLSAYPNKLRFPFIIAAGITCFAYIFFVEKKITITYITTVFLLTFAYIIISIFYSYDPKSTQELALIYLCSTIFLLTDFPDSFFQKLLTVISIICVVIAVSIIISVFIEDCMIKYFSFIVNPTNSPDVIEALYSEVHRSHAYSGFAREKAEAAYIMNVGIAVYFAKYFSGTKFKAKDTLFLVLISTALILTSKRMLFVCPVVIFSVLILLSKIQGKVIKIFSITLILGGIFLILMSTIPQMSNLFDRFMVSDSTDVLTGRGDLWSYSLEMFEKQPIWGFGLGSYNKFAFDHGLLVNGEQWNYFGHNVYYEILGEGGILGFIIIFGALLFACIATIYYIRNKNCTTLQRYILMFSLYIQLMFLIYCTTGNVLYYSQEIFMWYVAVGITVCVSRRLRQASKLKQTQETECIEINV